MTIYILDTSTLVCDPGAWKHFVGGQIIIPIAVLNELDNLKKNPSDVGKNARVCIRLLDELSNLGDISCGIVTPDGTTIKIDVSDNVEKSFGPVDYGDTQILSCAYTYYKEFPDEKVVLVSNDINLRVKAKARGIDAVHYEGKKFSASELYAGLRVIDNTNAALQLGANGTISASEFGIELNMNESVFFEKENVLGRKVGDDVIKLIKKSSLWGIYPKNKEQACAMDLILDKAVDLVTLTGAAGAGKAQPLDAKVLTPDGWKIMADLKLGDKVSTPDGKFAEISKIFPQGELDIYKISFSDGTSTECCENHLWLTQSVLDRAAHRPGTVKTTKEIKDSLKYKNKKNHSIPIVKAIEINKKDQPLDPYVFGCLLGDGSFRHQLSFCSSDDFIINNIKNKIISLDLKMVKKNKCNYIIKSSIYEKKHCNKLLRYLKDTNLWMKKSHEKFIPDIYKFSSIEDRIGLLQGLMDTDGSVDKSGKYFEFTTTSPKLIEDFVWLVQSLGGTAKFTSRQTKYKYKNITKLGRVSYRATVLLPNEISPFKLPRKCNIVKDRKKYLPRRYITSIDFIGKKQAQCILINNKDHLYITNDCIVTHNTLIILAAALELVINKRDYNKFIIYRPIQPVGNDIGFLPGTLEEKLSPWFAAVMDGLEFLLGAKNRDWKKDLELWQKKDLVEFGAITYVRGRSIPNSIILIEEAQNISSEEIKTILTRAGSGTKVILNGDLDQIDRTDLDATNNGLIYVIEKFKNLDMAGHINFTQGERSRLATKAAEIL